MYTGPLLTANKGRPELLVYILALDYAYYGTMSLMLSSWMQDIVMLTKGRFRQEVCSSKKPKTWSIGIVYRYIIIHCFAYIVGDTGRIRMRN